MPTYHDFQKASFKGIEFPYSKVSIKGGIRHHVHEYPHSAGGDVEKMGRKLYVFRFSCPFHDLPGSKLDADFGELFTTRLHSLIDLFDDQTTANLVVPSIGTIKCVATDWDGTADMGTAHSGEDWNFEFIEDVDQASLVEAIPTLSTVKLRQAGFALQTMADAAGFKPGPLDLVQDKINDVLGVLGEGDQWNRLVAGKIEGLAQLCGRADREVKEFLNPMNSPVLEALKDVWANAVDLAENIPGVQGGQLSKYRVPRLMSVGQIAQILLGSAERGVDIMQINPIDDPFAIKAGTQLQYVKA